MKQYFFPSHHPLIATCFVVWELSKSIVFNLTNRNPFSRSDLTNKKRAHGCNARAHGQQTKKLDEITILGGEAPQTKWTAESCV